MLTPALRGTIILDQEQLLQDIVTSTPEDEFAQQTIKELETSQDSEWKFEQGLLRHMDKIYVPDAKDLRLRIIQNKHNHILAGHYGCNKTLQFI